MGGGQVAQSVEQGTENPCVDGSIPPLPTIFPSFFHQEVNEEKKVEG